MYLLKQLMVSRKRKGLFRYRSFSKFSLVAVLSFPLFFSGCFLFVGDDDSSDTPFSGKVVVTTVASDYSSGAHSMATYDKPRTATNDLVPTVSDIAINAYGEYFYRIERYNHDTITKFSSNAPGTPIWQFSTIDSNDDTEGIATSNPYQLVFVSESKAYLIRYGSKRAWIVNPSATTQADFKIGELDLSAYVDEGDTDGVPEMAGGVVIGSKLFILMQRLDGYSVVRNGYVGVFNILTDTEINTGMGSSGLLGIELTSSVQNPTGMTASGNILYVSSLGNYSDQGGIDKIDASSYAVSNLINGNPIGDVAIVNSTTGYYVDYISWGNTKIYPFNPSTLDVGSELTGVGNDHRVLVVDPDSNLWIGDGTTGNSGIYVVNTSDNSVDEGPISTNLVPSGINFVD